MEVEYRELCQFCGYLVGDDGSVWSVRTKHGERTVKKQLKPSLNKDGYLDVRLRANNGQFKHMLVHRLVLIAFRGHPPIGMQACHFPDRNRTNNNLENLRWGTPTDNVTDRQLHGTTSRGSHRPLAKLDDMKVAEIIRRLANGESRRNVAADMGVSQSAIWQVEKRRTWKHVGIDGNDKAT